MPSSHGYKHLAPLQSGLTCTSFHHLHTRQISLCPGRPAQKRSCICCFLSGWLSCHARNPTTQRPPCRRDGVDMLPLIVSAELFLSHHCQYAGHASEDTISEVEPPVQGFQPASGGDWNHPSYACLPTEGTQTSRSRMPYA